MLRPMMVALIPASPLVVHAGLTGVRARPVVRGVRGPHSVVQPHSALAERILGAPDFGPAI